MFREGEKRSSSRGESDPKSFCTSSKGRFALTSRTVYAGHTKITQRIALASLQIHLKLLSAKIKIYK
jgi:hypothetical protein